MRILHVSKALVVGAYQTKMEALAALPNVELCVAVPPSWKDERGTQPLEVTHTQGYALWALPMMFNGSFHLHFYPGLRRLLEAIRPDLLHFDEEPYNLATAHAALLARRVGVRFVFFTWQNLLRAYPWPFSWLERLVYRLSDYAIVGNRDAGHVLRAKGYSGPLTVIPQFGVDPERFRPVPRDPSQPFTIGYAGRFVQEKGLLVLLAALADLPGEWQFVARGSGPLATVLSARAAEMGLGEHVSFLPPLPSTQMPSFYQALDLIVLPSLTRPNWKEQFGRVLVEAMACGVPPIGSASGEIPNVIGDAGVVGAEGDADALRAAIARLMAEPGWRARLGEQGRQRVLAQFTQAQIARRTWDVYCQVLGLPSIAA